MPELAPGERGPAYSGVAPAERPSLASDERRNRRRPPQPRAVFVLGCPRSGTTLIGNYLGSSAHVLNLAEYGGFYVAHSMAPAVIKRLPGFHHDEYLAELRNHAQSFAERLARSRGCSWYLDHTPWNLEVAPGLAAAPADAVFVLMLRHYAGAILSMRRLPWFGDTWEDCATLWANLCGRIIDLPSDRVIPVGYDALAAQPEHVLAGLLTALAARGFPAHDLDARILTVSHAALIGEPRPVISTSEEAGAFRFQPVRSFDAERWSGDIHAKIWPIVRDTHFELLRRFPGVYVCPPQPRSLKIHHQTKGLIDFKLEAW
jgi:hypothetical protein